MDSFTHAQLRLVAMNLLARREYSAEELRQKLSLKSSDSDVINQVIQRLIEDGLQSDERFTQAFTSMRLRQGKGSAVVGFELKQRGISPQLIDDYVNGSDSQWQDALSQLINRRFAGKIAHDPREKAKQLRFLQSRGFTQDQIRQVISELN